MEDITKTAEQKQLSIEFLYADLSVCIHCRETDRNLFLKSHEARGIVGIHEVREDPP